eukprot:NODE_88_length_21789_cov_0.534440.p9 type:complete len:243 gc:universal NODE_88_length_21789_cov_0.534440:6912-6184(-)
MIFSNSPSLKLVLIIGSVLSYWNSVTKKDMSFFYTSTFDWILGSLILYNTRHVEKFIGPAKFTILQTVNTLGSGLLIYYIGGAPNLALWSLSTIGPYYSMIPYSHLTKFGPIPFTNKWYVYAFALQMVFTNPYYIIAPLVSFITYNKLVLKLKSNLFLQLDSVLNKLAFTTYKDETFFGRSGRRFEQEPRGSRNQSQVPQPNNSALRQLTDMGFSTEQSTQALLQSNNNIEQALAILLASQQ